ncbi:hypothetical protein [Vibrio cincinnatiensis]|uniref:hypothetical protein n=1 Tax=Vibrio cincinnatiensis TaxID=675 RepID=UPI001EDD30EF|nr:hypothetical protein [Vibrio cincinnatiensis]MCG3734499.1 hypothetical protein [Vibrio cincinnatiensis]
MKWIILLRNKALNRYRLRTEHSTGSGYYPGNANYHDRFTCAVFLYHFVDLFQILSFEWNRS